MVEKSASSPSLVKVQNLRCGCRLCHLPTLNWEASMQMNTPLKKIGKYEIQEELGMGGMGVVYKGWDPVITREVAIKMLNKKALHPSERETLLGRFRQKAQAVGRLVHPRIIQIYDYIEDELSAYIIMELVHGKTLAQLLESHESFGLWEIGQIISQTLDGIGYAHTQGVVH